MPEVKSACLVSHSKDDTLIEIYLRTARQYVETRTNRALITQTLMTSIDYCWPTAPFFMPRSPLVSVDTIDYIDADGAAQTLDPDDLIVDINHEPGRIAPAYGECFPRLQPRIAAATINFTAGYGDAPADVPDVLRTAIMILCKHYYDYRDEVSFGAVPMTVPFGAIALMDQNSVKTSRITDA